MATGSTSVSATLGLISGSTTLTVDPASLVSIVITPDQTSCPRESARPLWRPEFSITDLLSLWSRQLGGSTDSKVAPIDNTGSATTLTAGTVTVSATSGLVTGTTTFTHWSTSAANLVTINSGQTGGGLSTAKAAGTATITAAQRCVRIDEL